MTHDELLEDINEARKSYGLKWDNGSPYLDALRAVVELHKPMYIETEGGEFQLCTDCSRRVDTPGYGVLYPCKTIQAIEKEL
jgi:hypothetical protein